MANPWQHPKSGIYYHRVDVPKDLRSVFGKTTIKYSLETKDPSEAKRLFAVGYAKTLERFRQAREGVKLTPKDIEVLASRWLSERIEDLESGKSLGSYIVSSEYTSHDGTSVTELSSAGDLLGDALERGYNAQHSWVGKDVENILEDNGLVLRKDEDAYKHLTAKLCEKYIELSRIALDRYNGVWSSTASSHTQRASEALSVEGISHVSALIKTSCKPLSAVVASYLDYKTASGKWDTKTAGDAKNVCDQLMEYVGKNVDPSSITREQLRGFAVLLSKLPKNYTRQDKFKGLSLSRVVSVAEDEDLELPSSNSVRKKLVFIKALFKYGAQEEWIDKNRAEGIVAPDGNKKVRLPFTPDKLNVLLSAVKETDLASNYWVPRIALSAGLRSNEILQLTVTDVRQVAGVWVFDINTNLDHETGKPKKVKRDNSVRLVPIPSVLLNLGFLSFVQSLTAPTQRLFTCVGLGSDGTYSTIYSKRFNGLLRELGLKPKPDSLEMLDFHSLRHTFRANLRAFGVSKEVSDLLGGWADQTGRTAGDNYGVHFESFIDELKRSIDQIDYSGLLS